jgi:hypothetical protein
MMAILKGWSLQCSVMFSVQMPEGICNERESDSAGAEDFAGEGEEGAGFVVPLDGAFEAPGGFAGLVGGHVLQESFQAEEAGAAGFEAGQEALADEAGEEGLQLVFGVVTGGAFAVGKVTFDGAEFFEGAESLADGAFADVEALGNVVHGEGVDGAKEESVNGTDGTGVAEEVGEVGEDVDKAVGKLRGGDGGVRGGVCGGRRHDFRGGRHQGQDSTAPGVFNLF